MLSASSCHNLSYILQIHFWYSYHFIVISQFLTYIQTLQIQSYSHIYRHYRSDPIFIYTMSGLRASTLVPANCSMLRTPTILSVNNRLHQYTIRSYKQKAHAKNIISCSSNILCMYLHLRFYTIESFLTDPDNIQLFFLFCFRF